MAIKDILALVDLNRASGATTAAALALASRTQAHVTGVALAVDPMVPAMMAAPIPVEFAETARQESLKIARAGLDRFSEAARLAGTSAETRLVEVLMGGTPESFLAQTHVTDLVVIGQEDPDSPEPMREVVIESVLMEGNAPLLVVPHIARGGMALDRAMIAWDGSRTAARAVRAALPLLSLAREVGIVMVGKALDVSGEPGAELATWLARHGLSVTVERIPAPETSVANALLNHASDRGYDMLIMGGYGHSRVREILFGGATRDILATMTVPVFMAH